MQPVVLCVLALLVGVACAAGGVYVLAGLGWALLCCAAPLLLFAAVLARGLTRAA